ncbi:hypothetical protein QYF36_003455 [Acer negundo]|nr:hypothetical protein QYF36_003455 [Acer negundo]
MTRGSRKHNKHIGNPCVVCALYELFALLTSGGEVVAAAFTSFRIAFTTWLPNFNIQLEIMHKHHQNSFDSLLRLVMTHELLACDEHDGGCGVLNPIYRTLNSLPYALTIVLGWQKNIVESSKDISETLSALSNELDLGVLFPAVKPGIFKYLLMSMVCFYGVEQQHYTYFIYCDDMELYIQYDVRCDEMTLKIIGEWDDVVNVCSEMSLRPLVMFFYRKFKL